MNDRALGDVKIVDFSWVMAGPAATRVLADYGATVVRVESSSRLDTGRTLYPFCGGIPHRERSAFFHNMNAGKRMLSLDLKHPHSREIVLDLVRWADVVMESFSPKAMRGLGYDYESLRRVKPDVVMISTCLMGQTGPLSEFAGYGNLAAALAGFVSVCGWPDRPPAGPFSAYTDYLAPRFTVCAILAALDHRRRTGEGQYIDQSQAESAVHMLTPAILDFTVNGRIDTRVGNDDPQMAPHGVYPAAGEDRWVAIAVPDDETWRRLTEVMARDDLGSDRRFANAESRIEHRAELDAAIVAWTSGLNGESIEACLQAAGVPCSVVRGSSELATDPQLEHRGHFVALDTAEFPATIEASRVRLTRTPAVPGRAVPSLGRDNDEVLRALLGYSDSRIRELVDSGALR